MGSKISFVYGVAKCLHFAFFSVSPARNWEKLDWLIRLRTIFCLNFFRERRAQYEIGSDFFLFSLTLIKKEEDMIMIMIILSHKKKI